MNQGGIGTLTPGAWTEIASYCVDFLDKVPEHGYWRFTQPCSSCSHMDGQETTKKWRQWHISMFHTQKLYGSSWMNMCLDCCWGKVLGKWWGRKVVTMRHVKTAYKRSGQEQMVNFQREALPYSEISQKRPWRKKKRSNTTVLIMTLADTSSALDA